MHDQVSRPLGVAPGISVARLRLALSSLCAVAWILWSPVIGAQDERPLAGRIMNQANAAFEAGDYETALELYRNADRVFSSPNTMLGVGMCLESLGRLGEAVASYLLTEAEAESLSIPRYEQALSISRARLEELRDRVSWLTVSVVGAPEGTSFSINDLRFTGEALGVEIPVTPGHIAIVIEAEGFQPAISHLEVAANERRNVELSLVPAREDPEPPFEQERPVSGEPPRPTGFAIGSGVSFGVAGIAAGLLGAFGVLALQRFNELDDICGSMRCPSEYSEQWEEGRSYQLAANVAIGVGATALAAGISFLVVALRFRSEGRAQARVGFRRGGVVLHW